MIMPKQKTPKKICKLCNINNINEFYKGVETVSFKIGICTNCLRLKPLDEIDETYREEIEIIRREYNQKNAAHYRFTKKDAYNAWQKEYRNKKKQAVL